MKPHGTRASEIRLTLVFLLVLLLLIPQSAEGRSHPSGADPRQDFGSDMSSSSNRIDPAGGSSDVARVSSLSSGALSVHPPTEPNPKSVPAASVLNTLILANHTLQSGNSVPLNGSYPEDLALDANASKLFVATEGGLVVVVNTATDRLDGTIAVAGGFWGIAYDSRNGEIYAAQGFGGNKVVIINAANDTIVGNVSVQSLPEAVTVDEANGRVYVMNTGSRGVSVINDSTNQVIGTISVGNGPVSGALDTSNGKLFVSNYQSDNVSIIDTATDQIVGTAAVGVYPAGIAYDPANGDMYVVNANPTFPGTTNGYVMVLNGSSGALVTTITVGVCPFGAAYDSATAEVYVADSECTTEGDITVINATTNSVAATIVLGYDTSPTPIVYDSSNHLLYAANYFSTNVSIINGSSHKIVGAVGAGELPSDLTSDSGNGLVFVADSGGNDVAIINGSTGVELGTIGSWYGPDGLAFDEATGNLYVANSFSDNVSVVNMTTDRIIASVAVGSFPQGVGYDPANGDIYVANGDSNNVSIIDAHSNRLVGSVGAGIRPQGVLFDPANRHIYITNSGPQSATGANENVTVIDGGTNRVVGSIPAGGGPWGAAYDPYNQRVYVANWASGNLTVINATSDSPISSIGLGIDAAGDDPTGVAYDARNGEIFVTYGLNFVTGDQVVAINGTTGRLLGNVVVGLFPLTATVDSRSGYLIVVNWLSGTVSFLRPTTYPPLKYSVTFQELGLAAGTSWSVTLNGTTNTSATSVVEFLEADGPYSYTLAPVSGYDNVSPANGTVTVADRNVTILLRFVAIYAVHFAETGLPTNFSWAVLWNGSTFAAAAGASFSVEEANGSYEFSVAPEYGYLPNPANGTILVNGANVSKSIQFVGPRPSVDSFRVTPASGPVGTTFTLTPGVSGGVGALTYLYFGLPGGCANANLTELLCKPWAAGTTTVEVIVTDALGRSSTANGTIHVTAIQVTQPHGPTAGPRLLGLPWDQGVALLVALVALIAVGTGVLLWRRSVRARAPPDASRLPRTE